jgi:hypothetical protein
LLPPFKAGYVKKRRSMLQNVTNVTWGLLIIQGVMKLPPLPPRGIMLNTGWIEIYGYY